MRELEEATRTLWLRNQDSALSIDRPLFGQHAPGSYIDPSSPPPSVAEIRAAFDTVLDIGARHGFGDFSEDHVSRFGRRLAHRLLSPLLPRITGAAQTWRAERAGAVPEHSVNWLGLARVEVPAGQLGRRLTQHFGPPGILAELLRQLNSMWGGMLFANRDLLLSVNSTVLRSIARSMLDATIENESQLNSLLAGMDTVDTPEPDDREAAIATLDTAFDYFEDAEFADLSHPSEVPAQPFEKQLPARQLSPFTHTTNFVVKVLVELGSQLRAFEVAQVRTDAMASIITELTTARGTSSVAIQRSNEWTHDLLVASENLGLVLHGPTPPQGRILDDFLTGFASATAMRTQVAGLAGLLAPPERPPSGWQAALSRLSRLAVTQKFLPRTWGLVPEFAGTPDVAVTGVSAHRRAVIRLRATAPLQALGRRWLGGLSRSVAASTRDAERRRAILGVLARGHARWLQVVIPRRSSRVEISIGFSNPAPRPLDERGIPRPLFVAGRWYTKYRGSVALRLHAVEGQLCLSETGDYGLSGSALDIVGAALEVTCDALVAVMTGAPQPAAGQLPAPGEAIGTRPVILNL